MARRLIPANPRSGAELDNLALAIVRRYQPAVLNKPSAFDIERFFEIDLEELSGVKSDYRELAPGIHGFTDSEKMECVVCKTLIEDPDQSFFCRSTMAHECGHSIEHVGQFRLKKALLRSIHDSDHVTLRIYRESEIELWRNPEWQAWRIAGGLLMPTPTISDAVRRGYSVKDMSDIFQVNKPFVAARLRALKLATKE